MLLAGSLSSLSLMAQPQLKLRLKFNEESNHYEVLATPNFTDEHYTWGPSQVSVVVPSQVADVPISTRSSQAGLWLDQSTVFGPQAAANRDFHGFATLGGKLNLRADEEVLLFDFSFQQGFVEGVRLFDASADPDSRSAGMAGGDFRTYLSSDHGTSRVSEDFSHAELRVTDGAAREAAGVEATIGVVAYPNPVASGKVRLFMKGFDARETVRVQISSMSGILLRQFDEQVSGLAGREVSLPENASTLILITVTRMANNQRFTQKVWTKE